MSESQMKNRKQHGKDRDRKNTRSMWEWAAAAVSMFLLACFSASIDGFLYAVNSGNYPRYSGPYFLAALLFLGVCVVCLVQAIRSYRRMSSTVKRGLWT